MEPKVSMTAYVIALTAIELLFIAAAYPGAVIFWLGIGVGGWGLASYLRFRWLTRGYTPPEHRRQLDRWVIGQWTFGGVSGITIGLLAGNDRFHPLAHSHPFFHALIIAATIGAPAVFLSSLVDWYWILPRIGGFGDYYAPCEEGGQEQWSRITSLWLIHRALATAVIAGAITAVPLYMVSISNSGTSHAAWDVVAIAFAGAAGIFSRQAFFAGFHAFNPPVHVGDLIQVRLDRWKFEPRDAYVVDVAREGSKIKDIGPYLRLRKDCVNGTLPAPVFHDKGDGEAIPNEELRRVQPSETTDAPCRECCLGINWYCRNNPRAYTASPKRRRQDDTKRHRSIRSSTGVPRRHDRPTTATVDTHGDRDHPEDDRPE